MTEANLKEYNIDQDNEVEHEEEQEQESKEVPWYLINKNKAFCRLWDQMIMYIVIYSLFVCPYIMSFGSSIMPAESSLWNFFFICDVIMTVDVVFNFLKADSNSAFKDLKSISENYLSGYFIFDFLACVPTVILPRNFGIFWLHMFRIVHMGDLTDPINKVCYILLGNMVKKRRVEVTKFANIIFYIMYLAHTLACIMIHLGLQEKCEVAGNPTYKASLNGV